jgi:GNAT superfamily N-acetyltransferase
MDQNGSVWNNRFATEKAYFLREMKESDIQSILRLQDKILTGFGADQKWFYPFQEAALREIICGGSSITVGIHVENDLIAFRTGCFSGKEYKEITTALEGKYCKAPCFLMNGVLVHENYRGNRLQQRLSEHCMELCGMQGVFTFISVVHPENFASIQSLKRCGFKEKRKEMLFGGEYERLIMVKERDKISSS